MKIKRFNTFINESYLKGANAPLSHSTNIWFAKEILKTNSLTRTNDRPISFSRDPNYVYLNFPITFVFDADKLRHNYKLVPFDYMNFKGMTKSNPKRHYSENPFEFEETVNKDINHISKYLIEIRLNKSIDRLRDSKRNTRQEYKESYEDFLKEILEFREKNYSSSFKILFKGKEVDETWILDELPDDELEEGIYNKMSGTRIYVTKAADQGNYRVYYSSYKPLISSGDDFVNFLNTHDIKHSNAGKCTLHMNKENVKKLKQSMLNLTNETK
jgi:hypothetical protein